MRRAADAAHAPPWARTLERAREIGLPVVTLDPWYDVDDRASLAMLEQEFDGIPPSFAREPMQDAPRTRAFVARRRVARAAE